MSSLSNLALKSFITGVCSTSGIILVLGVSWRISYMLKHKTFDKPKQHSPTQTHSHSEGESDSDIDHELVDSEKSGDFKKLFDNLC
jgi:hypothetical protein